MLEASFLINTLSQMTIIFETERLIVREMTRDDYDNFFLLHGNAEVMRYIRPVHTREESDARLNDWFAQPYTQPFLGRGAVHEKVTNTFIGSFIMAPIPTEPEKIQLGYSFLPEYWGRGYGTEVTKAARRVNDGAPEIVFTSSTRSSNSCHCAEIELDDTCWTGDSAEISEAVCCVDDG